MSNEFSLKNLQSWEKCSRSLQTTGALPPKLFGTETHLFSKNIWLKVDIGGFKPQLEGGTKALGLSCSWRHLQQKSVRCSRPMRKWDLRTDTGGSMSKSKIFNWTGFIQVALGRERRRWGTRLAILAKFDSTRFCSPRLRNSQRDGPNSSERLFQMIISVLDSNQSAPKS